MQLSRTDPIKIIMLGAGGTGGYIAPHLYRMASLSNRNIRIVLCDGDTVEDQNLTRQNFIDQDVGQKKSYVLAQRYSAAFGIDAPYIPFPIESDDTLYSLLEPDTPNQMVILLACVDNNRTRQICHRVFCRKKNLIYIDAGNGESTGQVVCGVRRYGRTQWRPAASLYKEILSAEDKLPSQLSCAEQAKASPQSITANLMAATIVVCILYTIFFTGQLLTRHITFSSLLGSARAIAGK